MGCLALPLCSHASSVFSAAKWAQCYLPSLPSFFLSLPFPFFLPLLLCYSRHMLRDRTR